jgi:hypothetical protein
MVIKRFNPFGKYNPSDIIETADSNLNITITEEYAIQKTVCTYRNSTENEGGVPARIGIIHPSEKKAVCLQDGKRLYFDYYYFKNKKKAYT